MPGKLCVIQSSFYTDTLYLTMQNASETDENKQQKRGIVGVGGGGERERGGGRGRREGGGG